MAFVVGLRPQASERDKTITFYYRGCDKKCLFWDVLGVLLMLGRGTCGTRRWLECFWRACDSWAFGRGCPKRSKILRIPRKSALKMLNHSILEMILSRNIPF